MLVKIGKPDVLKLLNKDANDKLTFNGEVVGARENDEALDKLGVDQNGQPTWDGDPFVASGESEGGAEILTVERYDSLPSDAADETIACVTEGGVDATPVTIVSEEDMEDEGEGESEIPYISNQRVFVNPMPEYDEDAFDDLLQYCLEHPDYDREYCDSNATYDSSQGYRYVREVSKEVYEDVTDTLSDGDSLAGLYRITGENYEFEPGVWLSDSYDHDSDGLSATVLPVFTSSTNVFTQNDVECENPVLINANATKKYALMVELSERPSNKYVKIGNHQYKYALAAIYAFEAGNFTLDMDGTEMSLDLVKGWNLMQAILEPNQEGYLEMASFTFEPATESIFLDTKADGIAMCDVADYAPIFADVFVTGVVVYENGFYICSGGTWNFTGSKTADTAKQALELAKKLAENEAISKLSADAGVLLYDGKPTFSPLEELLPDDANAFTQVSSGTTWSDGDTTQYYDRQEWYVDSGNVSFVPVPASNLYDSLDLSQYYTRSTRYDYRIRENRAYSIATPDVDNADVYLHFPAVNGDVDGVVTLYLHYTRSVTMHWGRVFFGTAAPTLVGGRNYMIVARYNTALGKWALEVTEFVKNADDSGVPAEQKTLGNCSWAEIAAISDNGYYDDNTGKWCTGENESVIGWFEVGDEKSVTLTDGTGITVQIYGFNHDDVGTGAKAGITFGLKNAMPNRTFMNTAESNKGGWRESMMRTDTIAEYYDLLPQEMKDVIQTVRKKTTEGYYSRDVEVTNDKLFLFAYSEVFDNTEAVYQQEGETYPIFTDQQSRIKNLSDDQNASPCWWWLRSPDYDRRSSFRSVNEGGWSYYNGADSSGGVVFGFCI